MKKSLTFILSLAIAGSVCMTNGFTDRCAAESVGTEEPVFPWSWESMHAVTKTNADYQIADNLSVQYAIMPEGTIYLGSFTGSADGNLEIPSEIDGHTVTQIGYRSLSSCKGLTSVTIPDTVNRIMFQAFSGCSDLESVNIPEGVTVIESGTFTDCTLLTSVSIPESVTEIESRAFENCTSLEDINISDKVVTDHDAFKNTLWYNNQPDGMVFTGPVVGAPDAFVRGSHNLYCYKGSVPENSTVEIPYIVENIPEYAFKGQTGMTSVILPDRIDRIRPFTFDSCTGLDSVTIPENVLTVMSYAFNECTGLKTVTIENGVKNIQYSAFNGCSSLTKIVITGSVTYIEDNAFSDCSQDLTIYGYKDSAAEKYAQLNNIKFVLLDSDGNPVTTAVSTSSSSESGSKSGNGSPKTGDKGISGAVAAGTAAAALFLLSSGKRKRR